MKGACCLLGLQRRPGLGLMRKLQKLHMNYRGRSYTQGAGKVCHWFGVMAFLCAACLCRRAITELTGLYRLWKFWILESLWGAQDFVRKLTLNSTALGLGTDKGLNKLNAVYQGSHEQVASPDVLLREKEGQVLHAVSRTLFDGVLVWIAFLYLG